jgi:hypothetical protein
LPTTSFLTGSNPSAVAVADVNGDGRADLITADSGGASVSVLLGNGDGSFHSPASLAVGKYPTFVSVADVNGDGHPDLIAVNNHSGGVSVLLGNGDGTFGSAMSFVVGAYPQAVAVLDVNGDGRLDLVVTNSHGNSVSVLVGNGDGTFQRPLDVSVGAYPAALAVGDLNGDGRPDLVTANATGNSVSVLLSNRDGTLGSAGNFTVGAKPDSVALADVNADGRLDVITANASGSVSLLLSNGDGTFANALSFPVGVGPRAVAVADINGDGFPDVITANQVSHDVSVLLGNGDGTFQGALTFDLGSSATALAVADVNGDGSPDLIAAAGTNSVSVLLNSRAPVATGSFRSALNFDVGARPLSVAVADFNGDGRLDLVTTDQRNARANVLLGNGDGTFQGGRIFAVGSEPTAVAAADVNGDGHADLITTSFGSNRVSVRLGNGNGTFQSAEAFPSGIGSMAVAVADVNNDGNADLVIANYTSASVCVLLGNGDGTFRSPLAMRLGGRLMSVAVADVNGDGRPDLIAANTGSLSRPGSSVSVLLGNGDGTFASPVKFAVGLQPTDVAVADVNGDGRRDLITANNRSGSLSVLLGNGDGTFQSALTIRLGSNPIGLAVADVNGDGHLDLISANGGSKTKLGSSVSVLLGNGDGTFASPLNFSVGARPTDVAVGDFNGDGRPDLVTSNFQIANVSVLLGNRNAATHLAISAPSGGPTGRSVVITVTALTAGNQLDAGYTGTVHFSSSDAQGQLPADYTFTPGDTGSHTFTVTSKTIGSQTLTATDLGTASLTGSATFIVAAPGVRYFAVGADAGGGPEVKVYDAATGALKYDFMAYDVNFHGGVRVAVGDVNGDGVPDIVTAPGPGGGPEIEVFDGATGNLIRAFFAFAPAFPGGAFVAVGDVNHDGFADIVVGADAGGGPQVTIFSGKDYGVLYSFFAFDPRFAGGVRVACGDVNGDGHADVITAAGPGGGPNVAIFSGKDGTLLRSYFAYDPSFHGGVYVACGDVNGDGHADLITGAGPGGGPQVEVFNGGDGGLMASFFAFAPNFSGGVRVGAVDVAGLGRTDLVTGAGAGGGPHVQILEGTTLTVLQSFFAFDVAFSAGIFVGGH